MSLKELNQAIANIKNDSKLSESEKRKHILGLQRLYKTFNGHSIMNYI